MTVDGEPLRVRDAMVPEPLALDVSRSAQEAAEALTRDEVRAVLVCGDGRLVGVITRKTLVREVVAAGRDSRHVTLREIAEEPNATLESSMALNDAFAFLEERDFERVPVVDDGKLVGVLSRAVVRRRLAEDEPPEPDAELG
jgi:CBS domain-containing protein